MASVQLTDLRVLEYELCAATDDTLAVVLRLEYLANRPGPQAWFICERAFDGSSSAYLCHDPAIKGQEWVWSGKGRKTIHALSAAEGLSLWNRYCQWAANDETDGEQPPPTILDLHEEATHLAQQAQALMRRAATFETDVADRFLIVQPQHAQLQHSAATMAWLCGNFGQARRLIQTGLANDPPPPLDQELAGLLDLVTRTEQYHRDILGAKPRDVSDSRRQL